LKANIWWESDLKHLFPVGEVNGSHGVYRPGGSALNSGQVGSFRAAQYISKKYLTPPMNDKDFFIESAEGIKNTLALVSKWMQLGSSPDNKKYLSEIRKRMTDAGGIIRNIKKVEKASSEAEELLEKLPKLIGAGSVRELYDSFMLMDQCFTHLLYLGAINFYIAMGGRSRGSYIVVNPDKFVEENKLTNLQNPELCRYDSEVENKILVTCYKDGAIHANLEEVREIPEQNLWFEKVWKDYLEDNFPDD
jgi:succinate dehydrogenase/fumarate reductase flavoprotein subunit